MHHFFNPPLRPRDGYKLRVILVCRVSDPRPGKQRETSTADQERLLREILAHVWKGPIEIIVISGSGSGENLDREEFLELCALVEKESFDLVLVEDLGRIVRRMQAHIFAETCVDCGVRLVAVNDHVDTESEGWQDRSIFSAWHHERSNRDASERIKRSHRASFERGGCLPPKFVYGIVKPPGAKHESECYKLPEAESVYQEWFERLDRGQSFAEIADWLNEQEVPTGPGTRRATWNGPLVGKVTRNPILKGVRCRNNRKTRRNARGRYESRKADPGDLLSRRVPHLAFIDETEYDRIVAKVDAKNRHCSRGNDGVDTRKGVSRKRTRFPGQSLYCGICGRLFVFDGLTQWDKLRCDGSRNYLCWNSIGITGRVAAEKIVDEIWSEIERLPDFDEAFLAEVQREANRLDADRLRRQRDLDREVAHLEDEYDKLLGYRATDRLRERQVELESRLDELGSEREALLRVPGESVTLPSVDEIRALASEELRAHATEAPAFVRVVRAIVPRIVVFPYRILDGNRIEHRARFKIQLGNLLQDERARESVGPIMERLVECDLFVPPQYVAVQPRIVKLRSAGRTEQEAADECGVTRTAAQRAASLQRQMIEKGLDDPWVPLNEPPNDIPKMKRHRHTRYRFKPLADAGEV